MKTITIVFSKDMRSVTVSQTIRADELKDTIDQFNAHMKLDFTHVHQMNSADISMLLTFHKQTIAAGGALSIFNVQDKIYEIFGNAALVDLLQVTRGIA